MTQSITVHHYSDLLCVWAYVSDIRVRELQAAFGDRVELDFRFVPVFGDVPRKLADGWGHRGGVTGYSQHVIGVIGQFPHAEVHPEVWVRGTPQSSYPGHLYLSAVALAEADGELAPGSYAQLAWRLRTAFFAEAQDISAADVLRDQVGRAGLAPAPVERRIASGAAYARLAADIRMAQEQNVRSSPTLIFNEDRQRLTGNVGYRIIEANVRELLERPAAQHSWC